MSSKRSWSCVTRLVLDHPASPILERRLAVFHISQCALTVCADDSMSVSFGNLSLKLGVVNVRLVLKSPAWCLITCPHPLLEQYLADFQPSQYAMAV